WPAALPPVCTHFRFLRGAGGFFFFHRPDQGTAAMVGPRHVRTDRYAACPPRGPAHLRHRGVDALAQDRIGPPRSSERANAVLRHGTWSRRSGGGDQPMANSARRRRQLRGFLRISQRVPVTEKIRRRAARNRYGFRGVLGLMALEKYDLFSMLAQW